LKGESDKNVTAAEVHEPPPMVDETAVSRLEKIFLNYY